MAIHWMPWCWVKARVSADDRAGARDWCHADARRQRHRRQDSCPSASRIPAFADYTDKSQLPAHLVREVKRFFQDYKVLEHKQVIVEDLLGPQAITIINDALDLYRKLTRGALEGALLGLHDGPGAANGLQ